MAFHTVTQTGSTNADMLLLAQDGAVEGTWLRAERQTAGKGRHGRIWSSPPGNLYASTLVRLRPNDPAPSSLALVAAVALQEVAVLVLPAASSRPVLKWPNDLLIAGAKVSGILLERSGDVVVIGIGVNVADHPDFADRLTTSLAVHGANVDVETLLDMLAEALARWLRLWREGGLPPIRTAWLAAAHPIGTALAVRLPDGSNCDGLFDGLDEYGGLILRLAGGERRVMHAGDVFLL